jgi:hypothetical protein
VKARALVNIGNITIKACAFFESFVYISDKFSKRSVIFTCGNN